MTRSRWMALGAVVATIASVIMAGPVVARRQVEATIDSRSHCRSRVAGLSVGATAVSLTGVSLECPFGRAELERVEVGLDWWARRVRSIDVQRGRVVARSLPPAPARSATGGSDDSEGLGVSVTDIEVELLGREDRALLTGTFSLSGTPTRWTITARDLDTAADLHPHMAVAEAVVVVDRASRGVEEAAVQDLVLETNEGARLDEAARAWMRPAGLPEDDGDGADPSGSSVRWWSRLREGGVVRISNGTVRDAEGVALSGMETEFGRVHGSVFHTSGRGQPRERGELSWDVRIDVAEEQIDGPITVDRVPLSVFLPFLPELPLHDPGRTLVSARAEVHTEPDSVLSFEGSLRMEGLGLDHVRIASAPVLGITFEVEGAGRWRRRERELELERATLRMGRATATLSARGRLEGDQYALDLRTDLPSTPCEAAVHAIPAGFLQDLTQMHLEGRIAASLTLRVDSERLDEAVLRFAIDDRCRFTSVPSLADVTRFQGPFEHEVLEPDGTVFAMETGPGTAAWTPIHEISPFMLHAALAHEDASFFQHHGFAPWAIRDALVRNLRERRYVLGASTITMQLVKNVFLRREKTLARKVQEVLLTWWIESAMTKAQILELYLNVIEYGPQVYGIRNASRHYFGREPSELSVAEAAYLAMILPNPPGFHEHFEHNELPASFRRRTEGFVTLLERRGRIDAEAAAQGREELAIFAFSQGGERTGPDSLRGGSAQLPIEGFSGFPAGTWESDESARSEDGGTDPGEDETAGWEEVWP